MGYPPEKQFNVAFDTAQMDKEINIDTTKQLQYEKRIEYQELQTAKKLQVDRLFQMNLLFCLVFLLFILIMMNMKAILLQIYLKMFILILLLDYRLI